MIATGIFYSTLHGEDPQAPVTWGVKNLTGGVISFDGGLQFLESLPTGAITLIRYTVTTPAPVGDSPFMQLEMLDSASALVPTTEWAALSMNWGTSSADEFACVAGSVLFDGDHPPGAGYPYSWEWDAGDFAGAENAYLNFMSWAKA